MYHYGIDENNQPAIEFVRGKHPSRTPFVVIGGVAPTEERAKILLRRMIKQRDMGNAKYL